VQIVGLIPAAGLAKRLAPLPCSKELYPIGVHDDGRPKVVTHYLLEKMRTAGISKVYVVLCHGKWDIPTYFGSGTTADIELAYLVARVPYGPPDTLDAARSFVQDSIVAFGFPDIVFEGDAAFARLLQRQADSAADVVLGLFPTDQPEIMDMVRLDDDGRVDDLLIRPQQTDLTQCWAIAVWTPAFYTFPPRTSEDTQCGRRFEPRIDCRTCDSSCRPRWTISIRRLGVRPSFPRHRNARRVGQSARHVATCLSCSQGRAQTLRFRS
jgi:glucose-1-phosphate thymidylyltransferase